MNKTEVEQLLSTFLPLKKNIQTLKRQIYMIDNLLIMPLQNSGNKYVKTCKLNEKMQNTIIDALKTCEIIETLIETLPNPYHQAILRMRYIEGLDWRTISEKVNYCQDYCIRLKNAAINKLIEINDLSQYKSIKYKIN